MLPPKIIRHPRKTPTQKHHLNTAGDTVAYNFIKTELLARSYPLSWRRPLSYCSANQCTGFYMITASVKKGLTTLSFSWCHNTTISGVGGILDPTLINSIRKPWNMLRHCPKGAYVSSILLQYSFLFLRFRSLVLSINVTLKFSMKPVPD